MLKFNFTGVHALSVLVVLLIIVFLFNPTIFGNMINTFLGRLLLLSILIVVVNYHVIPGLICVLLIIAIYENYNRFEGFETKTLPSDTNKQDNKPKEKLLSTEAGATSTPTAVIDTPSIIPDHTSGMDISQKSELESQITKGNDSKQLANSSPIAYSTQPNPSESTTTTNTSSKQGFANMFGLEYGSPY